VAVNPGTDDSRAGGSGAGDIGTAIHRYRVEIAQGDLDDLRKRLAATRWPDSLPETGWRLGSPVSYLRELAKYWETEYDWRRYEARLNDLPQFTTQIDGQQIHFLHVRSPEPEAVPLLLGHGWPSSVVEFLNIIGPLSDPRRHGGEAADAFTLVVPSLPGFGFSGPTHERGWGVERIARALSQLMTRLGYSRYVAHGSDWGSIILRELGRLHPDRMRALHVTSLPSAVPTTEPDQAELTGLTAHERERVHASLRRRAAALAEEAGSAIVQSTRPQTLAYGLSDSPGGQLAWIVEKFKEWTGCAHTPDDAVDRDQMLTNVSVYWLTVTANSSARLYYETMHSDAGWAVAMRPSTVPTGVAVFPRDTAIPVRHLAERTNTITGWSEFDRGGHFPAMEVPDLLVADLRGFFRSAR
jgi:pimeloyl-ACP methyl ester carboxylesterase